MQKITPFLWFDTQAEEAANFYNSIFDNSKISSVSRYNESSAKARGMKEGPAFVISFKLEGQNFTAMNAGLIDEFSLHIAPIILGAGVQLFEHLDKSKFSFEIKEVVNSPEVTHLSYIVKNIR